MEQIQIAVIDDDDLVRAATGSLLRSLGHDAILFDTAETYLQAGPPRSDCVICDYRMPGCSGLDLLEQLNGLGIRVPFVLMTGHGSSQVVERAARLGVLSLLEKPFADADLIALIESLA